MLHSLKTIALFQIIGTILILTGPAIEAIVNACRKRFQHTQARGVEGDGLRIKTRDHGGDV